MDAVLFHAKDEVSLHRVETPKPSDGEVLLRVRAASVSPIDVSLLRGRFADVGLPIIPGHQFAGEVAEIGPGVSGITVGDRVVVDPLIGCGRCLPCGRGRTNLCEHIEMYGATLNGGLAEYCAVRAQNVVAIGDLDFSLAALASATGGLMNGLSLVGPGRGDTALIFGAGPIGLLSAMIMRSRGVMSIVVIDGHAQRLEIAEAIGFRGVPFHSQTLDAMRHGADIVVEATGISGAYARIGNLAADGGRILLLELPGSDAPLPISSFDLVRRQLTVVGSNAPNDNLREALGVLISFGPDASRLVTRKLPLREIVGVFADERPAYNSEIQAVIP